MGALRAFRLSSRTRAITMARREIQKPRAIVMAIINVE